MSHLCMNYLRQTVRRVFDKFERLLCKAAVSLTSLDLIPCSTLDGVCHGNIVFDKVASLANSIRLPPTLRLGLSASRQALCVQRSGGDQCEAEI